MSRPLLDLVRERIAARVEEARGSTMLSRLGVWLGVLQDAKPWVRPDGLPQYSSVAEAAIACATGSDEQARLYFGDGMQWLQRRRFFAPGQSKSLEADPLACLAIAVGGAAIIDQAALRWLATFVDQALAEEQDPRRLDVFRLASAVAKGDDLSWSALPPLLAVACGHKLQRRATTEQQKQALKIVLSPDGPDLEWAIFYESALRVIFAMEAAIDVAQPTIDQVGELLRRIPAALKRWPWEDKAKTQHRDVTAQRWDIQHEYHVQSLIWAVLRPVFPGLEDEENLPSLGHKHPRADLLVPALRLVIEAKYLREATQVARAKVIEEIAADTAIYRTANSGYDSMITFIWDATGSNHHHAELEAGIRQLTGIVDVVIISRPGGWKS